MVTRERTRFALCAARIRKSGVPGAKLRWIVAPFPSMVMSLVITGRPLGSPVVLLTVVRVYVHSGASSMVSAMPLPLAMLIAFTRPAAPPLGPKHGTKKVAASAVPGAAASQAVIAAAPPMAASRLRRTLILRAVILMLPRLARHATPGPRRYVIVATRTPWTALSPHHRETWPSLELRERITGRLQRTTRSPLALTFHSYAYALPRRDAALADEPPPAGTAVSYMIARRNRTASATNPGLRDRKSVV